MDTPEIFEADTLKSAPGTGATDVPPHTPPLAKVRVQPCDVSLTS